MEKVDGTDVPGFTTSQETHASNVAMSGKLFVVGKRFKHSRYVFNDFNVLSGPSVVCIDFISVKIPKSKQTVKVRWPKPVSRRLINGMHCEQNMV